MGCGISKDENAVLGSNSNQQQKSDLKVVVNDKVQNSSGKSSPSKSQSFSQKSIGSPQKLASSRSLRSYASEYAFKPLETETNSQIIRINPEPAFVVKFVIPSDEKAFIDVYSHPDIITTFVEPVIDCCQDRKGIASVLFKVCVNEKRLSDQNTTTAIRIAEESIQSINGVFLETFSKKSFTLPAIARKYMGGIRHQFTVPEEYFLSKEEIEKRKQSKIDELATANIPSGTDTDSYFDVDSITWRVGAPIDHGTLMRNHALVVKIKQESIHTAEESVQKASATIADITYHRYPHLQPAGSTSRSTEHPHEQRCEEPAPIINPNYKLPAIGKFWALANESFALANPRYCILHAGMLKYYKEEGTENSMHGKEFQGALQLVNMEVQDWAMNSSDPLCLCIRSKMNVNSAFELHFAVRSLKLMIHTLLDQHIEYANLCATGSPLGDCPLPSVACEVRSNSTGHGGPSNLHSDACSETNVTYTLTSTGAKSDSNSCLEESLLTNVLAAVNAFESTEMDHLEVTLDEIIIDATTFEEQSVMETDVAIEIDPVGALETEEALFANMCQAEIESMQLSESDSVADILSPIVTPPEATTPKPATPAHAPTPATPTMTSNLVLPGFTPTVQSPITFASALSPESLIPNHVPVATTDIASHAPSASGPALAQIRSQEVDSHDGANSPPSAMDVNSSNIESQLDVSKQPAVVEDSVSPVSVSAPIGSPNNVPINTEALSPQAINSNPEYFYPIGNVQSPPPMMKFWAQKKGHINVTLKPRFFVLCNGMLTYFLEELGSEPPYGKSYKGTVCLSGYTVIDLADSGEMLYQLRVLIRNQADESKEFDLQIIDLNLVRNVTKSMFVHIAYANACRELDKTRKSSTSTATASSAIAVSSPKIEKSTSRFGFFSKSSSSSSVASTPLQPYELRLGEHSKWAIFIPADQTVVATSVANKPNVIGKAVMRQIILSSSGHIYYADIDEFSLKGTIVTRLADVSPSCKKENDTTFIVKDIATSKDYRFIDTVYGASFWVAAIQNLSL